jgi:hypothetical protein
MSTIDHEKTVGPGEDLPSPEGNLSRKRTGLRKDGIKLWVDALSFLTLLITAISGRALMGIHPEDRLTQAGRLYHG